MDPQRRPSTLTSTRSARFLDERARVRRQSPGRTSGRKDSERGQIGVRRREETDGWMMEPPEEREYAVEPVGVAMIMPSALGALG
jgi:hypothetical protein